MSPSILADFLAGRALPEQWLGLFILAATGVSALVLLLRQHVRDTRDEALVRRIVQERKARRVHEARVAGGGK